MNIPPPKTIYIAYELGPEYTQRIIESSNTRNKPFNSVEIAIIGICDAILWTTILIFSVSRLFI